MEACFIEVDDGGIIVVDKLAQFLCKLEALVVQLLEVLVMRVKVRFDRSVLDTVSKVESAEALTLHVNVELALDLEASLHQAQVGPSL